MCINWHVPVSKQYGITSSVLLLYAAFAEPIRPYWWCLVAHEHLSGCAASDASPPYYLLGHYRYCCGQYDTCWHQNTIKGTFVFHVVILCCSVNVLFRLYMWCDLYIIQFYWTYSLLSFDQLGTEFLEPFDRWEAQLAIEDSWTAEVQNWSISVIE